ncbi:hypothetical protein LY76DRAFT_179694 [Colletotrichum caudatum]|nr:hypothetical protein LY76DRAFT_179694 [Colletotrichum caudatum]
MQHNSTAHTHTHTHTHTHESHKTHTYIRTRTPQTNTPDSPPADRRSNATVFVPSRRGVRFDGGLPEPDVAKRVPGMPAARGKGGPDTV